MILSNWCHYKVTGDARFGSLQEFGDVGCSCDRVAANAYTIRTNIMVRLSRR